MPQLRQNVITGEWVVFAPERAKRPTDYISVTREKKQNRDDCPFCIDSKISEFPNRKKEFDEKEVYSITNKYPAFVEEPDLKASGVYKLEDEFYKMKLALGGHDVIVVKDHDLELPNFGADILTQLNRTFVDKFKYFKKIDNVEYVMPIYNQGPAAAASIEHPHAQIIASAVIPNSVAREISHTREYFIEHKKCAFCKLIEHELKQNTRVLFENVHFVAFNFYAAKFPFEVWIIPKKHESNFESISEELLESFSEISAKTFERFDETLKNPDMNFFIHSAPINDNELEGYHWHMEIAPRLTTYGGYELGSGMVIDIITPEQAAEFLRMGRTTKI